MNRKQFIRLSASLALLGNHFASCKDAHRVRSRIVGAGAATGHLLRDPKAMAKPPTETIHKDIVIAGGGISGLAAAWYLQQQGFTDFILLDLEKTTGGNAMHGSNTLSAYPWGAHYVPIPNPGLTEYLSFLQAAGVIREMGPEGLPVYNEEHLCFDPQERLFINGRWQEGLVPQFGVPTPEQQQISKFLSLMQQYRYARGSDGKDAFAIPVNASSTDDAWQQLDRITMKQWLTEQGFTSHYLHQYVNYCCRDDFGAPYDRASAWAGIHYFASRKGRGANAEPGDVLTWPEGNGFLADRLSTHLGKHIQTQSLVTRAGISPGGVLVEYRDAASGTNKAIAAKQCILAVPQFIAGRILRDEARTALVKKHFEYAPWMVANLTTTTTLKEREGHPASWDNVIFGSESLGYVEATHQLIQQTAVRKNLTYYYPLTAEAPATERKKAQQRTAGDWTQLILADLERVHPGITGSIEEINIMLWGHAMAQPLPGFITGAVRSQLSRSIEGKIHFAHTDLAGISIFEEAFYQGLEAAKNGLRNLS